MSDRIEIEEVSAVEQPPRARVEAAEETPGQTLERKRDYLEGFLAQKPAGDAAGEIVPRGQILRGGRGRQQRRDGGRVRPAEGDDPREHALGGRGHRALESKLVVGEIARGEGARRQERAAALLAAPGEEPEQYAGGAVDARGQVRGA